MPVEDALLIVLLIFLKTIGIDVVQLYAHLEGREHDLAFVQLAPFRVQSCSSLCLVFLAGAEVFDVLILEARFGVESARILIKEAFESANFVDLEDVSAADEAVRSALVHSESRYYHFMILISRLFHNFQH